MCNNSETEVRLVNCNDCCLFNRFTTHLTCCQFTICTQSYNLSWNVVELKIKRNSWSGREHWTFFLKVLPRDSLTFLISAGGAHCDCHIYGNWNTGNNEKRDTVHLEIVYGALNGFTIDYPTANGCKETSSFSPYNVLS